MSRHNAAKRDDADRDAVCVIRDRAASGGGAVHQAGVVVESSTSARQKFAVRTSSFAWRCEPQRTGS
eukprot:2455437-Prymnesium_polylepis.2